MSEKNEPQEVHEVAGGWITERKGTSVPLFLKLAYAGFCVFGLIYLFRYWAGETAHATRGPLVQESNKIMTVPAGLPLYVIAALLIVFVGCLFFLAFLRKSEE